MNLRELHPKRFFLQTWTILDNEARELRTRRLGSGFQEGNFQHGERQNYDFRPLVVFSVGALSLCLMEYVGYPNTLRALGRWWGDQDGSTTWVQSLLPGAPYAELLGFAWWSAWRVLGYIVIPVVSLILLGERIRDYGLRAPAFREHGLLYALMFVLVLIGVVLVSFLGSFRTYYPFYSLSSRSWLDFAAWELLYAAQFLSLEFFFRGYWLFACRSALGSHAIFAMVVPYCMIHFSKPFIECVGAIFAGIVLGTLALRTKSIWSGVLLHVAIAISMDFAALIQKNALPTQWLPGLYH